MTGDQAKDIIVSGIGQILSRPAIRWLLNDDQKKVLAVLRDMAGADPAFTASVAAKANQRGDEMVKSNQPGQPKSTFDWKAFLATIAPIIAQLLALLTAKQGAIAGCPEVDQLMHKALCLQVQALDATLQAHAAVCCDE